MRGRTTQAGSVAVEFGLILPLVLLLVVGMVDLGRAYRLKVRLTNAAREGAAFAQYYPAQVGSGTGCSDPNNVTYALRHEEQLPTTFTISVTNASAGGTAISGCNLVTVRSGTRVLVEAGAELNVLTPVLSALVGSTVALKGRAEIVVQG